MLIVHVYKTNGEKLHRETPRVTVDMNRPIPALIIGTLPVLIELSLESIATFWVEHV